MIDRVRELLIALNGVTDGARAAHEATQRLSAVQPILDDHQSKILSIQSGAMQAEGAIARLSASSGAAAGQVGSHLGTMVSTAAAAEASVAASSAAITKRAAELGREVPKQLEEVARAAETAQGQISTRLDDLQNAVSDHSNLWNKAVSELIDAVKIGAVPVQELINLYGDAQIGGQRLSEYLKGLDLTFYRDQVREMIQGLHEGTVEITRVQEYLGQTQLVFAKQLSDVIELFRKGSVTLKRVEEIVRQVQKAFPDSELSDLADALYQALKK